MMEHDVGVKPHPISRQGLCIDVVAYGYCLLSPKEEQK
jgi:hypothetical protein